MPAHRAAFCALSVTTPGQIAQATLSPPDAFLSGPSTKEVSVKKALLAIALIAVTGAAGDAMAQNAPVAPRTNDMKSTPDQGHISSTPSTSAAEAAAAEQIRAKGFTGVKGLSRDTTGTWRGLAIQNGQEVAVALDPAGNLTVQ